MLRRKTLQTDILLQGQDQNIWNFFCKVLPSVSGLNFASWLLFSVPLLIVNIFFGWLWLATMSKWSKGKADPTLILPINDDFNRASAAKVRCQFLSTFYKQLFQMKVFKETFRQLFCTYSFVLGKINWCKSCSYNVGKINSSSQFDQHFTISFCTNRFLPKNCKQKQ